MNSVGDLLQYGFQGFSVILMLLIFWLIRNSRKNITSPSKIQFAKMQSETKLFMGLSFLVFVGGFLLYIINPSNKIYLKVVPKDHQLQIEHQNMPLMLENGTETLPVRTGHSIHIDASESAQRLREAHSTIAKQTKELGD